MWRLTIVSCRALDSFLLLLIGSFFRLCGNNKLVNHVFLVDSKGLASKVGAQNEAEATQETTTMMPAVRKKETTFTGITLNVSHPRARTPFHFSHHRGLVCPFPAVSVAQQGLPLIFAFCPPSPSPGLRRVRQGAPPGAASPASDRGGVRGGGREGGVPRDGARRVARGVAHAGAAAEATTASAAAAARTKEAQAAETQAWARKGAVAARRYLKK